MPVTGIKGHIKGAKTMLFLLENSGFEDVLS